MTIPALIHSRLISDVDYVLFWNCKFKEWLPVVRYGAAAALAIGILSLVTRVVTLFTRVRRR